MGILGGIRDRIMGRRDEDDIGDIKSFVAGDGYDEKFRALSRPPEQETPPKPWEKAPLYQEPVTDEALPVAAPLHVPDERSNYEILDRLKFIESQLSAIRSQTETINERLKNMEMRTGRY